MGTDHLKQYQWKPGESGNGGKKKGARSRSIWYETMMGPNRNELFEVAIKKALRGDNEMIKMFMKAELPSKVKDELDEKLMETQIEYNIAKTKQMEEMEKQINEIKEKLGIK